MANNNTATNVQPHHVSDDNKNDERRKEAEEFENTKLGVKGLVDSGITQLPLLFRQPPEKLFELQLASSQLDDDDHALLPIIDMSIEHHEVVEKIRDAAKSLGFFQVINHGIPPSLLDRLISAVRAFHEELPPEEKARHYRRDIVAADAGFGFYSNSDLLISKAASWRDTIRQWLGPTPINPLDVPEICRSEVVVWDKEVKQLGERLVGLLCEGLGLSGDRLKGEAYMGKVAMVGQYYPCCPEPERTIGIASHTDLGILTILLQDQVGGLQVKHGDNWVNMKPVHGALVINIGDLFQILSNDNYVSGEHRVLANSSQRARVSVGTFFAPGTDEDSYGPLNELVLPENPAKYKPLKFSELYTAMLTKEFDSKSMASYFRL